MSSKELVLATVGHSRLAEDLSTDEIAVLVNLMTLQHYELNEAELEIDGGVLQDALMILVHGEIEIRATVDHEHVALHLEVPGDLARIISFVGGNVSVAARSTVLLLKRTALETLLDTHPSLAYYVMRNLVRHMHGVVRRSNTEKEEMSNYLYCIHGRY
jgi:CRP/FNR family cyclic AMP-dependent transcriptional regulator